MKKVAVIVACLCAALAIACTQYVHRGYVGVTDAGVIRVMDRGLHLRAPWHHVTFYPVETREVAVKSSLVGPRGRTDFDLTLDMRVCRDSVPRLHADYRGRHVEALVVPLVAGFLENRGGSASFFYGPEATAVGKEITVLLDSSLVHHGIGVIRAELRSYEAASAPRDDPVHNPR